MTSPSGGVTVVVPTWRRPELLLKVLVSIKQQTLHPDYVFVVGRAEDRDGQKAFTSISEQGWRWISVDRPGFLAPISTAVDEVQTELMAILDDDTEAHSDWLQELVRPFKDPSVACVGGRVHDANEPLKGVSSRAGQVTWFGKHVGRIGSLESRELVEVTSVMEGNWAWRTSILKNLEFHSIFDEGDGLNYGLDLCLQAKQRGFQILYTSNAQVVHDSARATQIHDLNWRKQRAHTLGRNLTFIGLTHYGSFKRASFIMWWWLIGERYSYGILKALFDLPRQPAAVLSILKQAMSGRAAGIRSWMAHQHPRGSDGSSVIRSI